ncbi:MULTISPECIES: S9 family peptidase [Bacillus]|uniref:S9 family peptidase n=1 Tax=Bacillus TaxID=1386 RepID=UPI0002D7148C|nr:MULTISPECIES: prolyl oligopeptidase family serine peptidase [Bacillus]
MISFPKPDVEQFLQTFSIERFAISPDETQLVFSTNLNGKFNLWGMDLPNHFPYPLTFINQSCQSLVYDKQGRFIFAGFDHDGDENTQLYCIPLHGGAMTPLVNIENTQQFIPIPSADGKRLYYTSSKENPIHLDAYCLHLESGNEEKIIEGKDSATFLIDISPDNSTYLYYKHFSNTHMLLYATDGEDSIQLTPSTDHQYTCHAGIFTSNSMIYFITNYQSDFSYLASFNLTTKSFKKVKQIENENFSSMKYDRMNQLLYLSGEKGVEDYLYVYDLQNQILKSLSLPCQIIDQFELSESGRLYLLGRSATYPQNIYYRYENKWISLTQNKVPGISSDELVEPDVITYRSFDGLEIEALFYKAKPENHNGELILCPHGGPQYAERKIYDSYFQLLLNQGYSIFAPNFRGSTGYGLTFTKMVEGDWGNGPRLDLIAGLDWLIDNGYTSKGNSILMGGSYGGYMALLLHGRHADYFKAVIDICGPSNLFSFIDTVPEFWKPVMDQWVGHPERDKKKLIEFSPITYIDYMTKPMLVIQGANDPRVIKEESDQIVQALKNKDRIIEYMVLEDEGHGFAKKENQIAVYKKFNLF